MRTSKPQTGIQIGLTSKKRSVADVEATRQEARNARNEQTETQAQTMNKKRV